MSTTISTEEKTIQHSENGMSAYLASLFFICFISNALSGSVSTLMSVYLPVAVKDLLGNTAAEELNYISDYIELQKIRRRLDAAARSSRSSPEPKGGDAVSTSSSVQSGPGERKA